MVLAMATHATPPVSMQGAMRPSGACLLVWRLHVDEVLELSTASDNAMLRLADSTDRVLPIHERSNTTYL
jgi:hypothetical protein